MLKRPEEGRDCGMTGATTKRHMLVLYFVLAYAFSWVIEIPLAAVAQGFLNVRIPVALHYLTAFGPLLAAFIVTGIGGGSEGIRDLVGRMLNWRVGLSWVLIAIFSPLVLFVLGTVAGYAAEGSCPDISLLGEVNFLPYLGIGAWVLWTLTSGFGEETGWRGYALPRLQKNRSALSATLILGVFWALWHLPAFFYLPNLMEMGLPAFPLFAIGVVTGAVLLTWLYNSTGGSILMVSLWHGSFNFVTASGAGQGIVAAITSNLVIVWAVILIIVFKPTNLSHRARQVL